MISKPRMIGARRYLGSREPETTAKESCADAGMTLFPRSMRASKILLVGAIAGAGALVLAGAGGGSSTPAEIGGATLAPEEAASYAALADTVPLPVQQPAPPKPAPVALADQLQLDRMVKNGDHFEAPLADGRRAVLTLDPELQALAEKLLEEARAPRGAIVAMAPDGRILALAGRRTADKGSIEGTFDWRLATDAWAPAASVFKLVTASALISAGVDPDDKVCFHGGIRSVVASNLVDDKHDNACQSLTFGVAHSNNAILGKLAYQHLEPVALDQLAKVIGLDHALGSMPGVVGQLALPQTHDLEFAKSAAGFVGSNLSGVGGALLAATFADGGEQPAPRLVDAILSGTDREQLPVAALHRVVGADIARAVTKMMVATCDQGSAAKSFGHRKTVKVAGKTGTLTHTEPFYMEHSWFVGYAPVDKPEIVVSVVLGNPENWHLRGQEAAKRMIDKVVERATRREKDRTQKVAIDKRVQW